MIKRFRPGSDPFDAGPRPAARARLIWYVRDSMRQPLFRNASALVFNTGITSVLGVIYWAIAARHYGVEEVGRSSALISIVLFLTAVAKLDLGSALTRFVPRAGAVTHRLVLWCYGLAAVLAIAVSLVATPFVRETAAGWFVDMGRPAIGWYVGAVVAFSLFALQDRVLVGLRQSGYVPVENALFGVAKIGLVVALAPISQQLGIFASWTIPMALTIVLVNFLLFGRLIPQHVHRTAARAEPIPLRMITKFVAFDYVTSLAALAVGDLLPVVVATLAGAEANAHFFIAWLISSAFSFALLSIGVSLTAEGAHDQDRLPELAAGLLQRVFMLAAPVVLAIVLSVPYLLGLFGGSYRAEATTLLRLLTVAVLPRIVIVVWEGVARVQRRVGQVLIVQATQSVVVLALSVPLLDRYGITGVGMAYLVSQMGVAVVLLPRLLAFMRTAERDPQAPVRNLHR
jgi:O-antigen/teichoic acid export membrane protein